MKQDFFSLYQKLLFWLKKYIVARHFSFPPGINKVKVRNHWGLITTDGKLLSDIIYERIGYDASSERFLARTGEITHLLDIQGNILFQTMVCDLSRLHGAPAGVGIFQRIYPQGDGTFIYISRNTLAGNGWKIRITRNGEEIGDRVSFIL